MNITVILAIGVVILAFFSVYFAVRLTWYRRKLEAMKADTKEIDRAKTDFISTASHQLRTPLTSIQWVVERILKTQKLTIEGMEYLDDIHTSVQRLNALVDLLLNVSRIEEGRISISPKSLELVAFLKNYFSECMPLSKKKNITLTLKRYPEKLEAVTDVGAFRNIVQSLVSNAIEYTPEGGSIEMDLEVREDRFLFSVRDSGIGIPKEEQSHIFNKFFRAENAKLVKTDGTGLGLYVAKQAVELLGGKIWFKSPIAEKDWQGAVGRGTAFYVELPIVAKQKEGIKQLA